MDNIGFVTAFFFGLISFVSPCVLPIVPGYISYMSGLSFEELSSSNNIKHARLRLLLNSVFFVIGFSIVFVGMGASASAVGKFLIDKLPIISKIAGVIIIFFGLQMIGIFRIQFLNYERRIHLRAKPVGYLGSLIIGLAFATGWTPCIGPILATILTLAANQETLAKGITLLACYSMGLGIPFIITGISITAFYKFFNKFKHHLRKVEFISGILLICFGILIITNYLMIIAGILTDLFPFLMEIG